MALEDWAYPPDIGGRWKIVLLGIALPLFIAYWAEEAWVHQEAVLPAGRRGTLTVTGDIARALAVCYLSAAAFCHFRWYWGLVSSYAVFVRGTVISLLAGLAGFFTALFLLFR